MALMDPVPTFEPDFWSDEVILNPYPHYDRLRALGPVVWLAHNQAWALTHYETVRAALLTPEIFSSASGCMMNVPMNDASKGIMLCSDDPEHLAMRRLFAKPLQPKALAVLRPRLEALVAQKIDQLVMAETFDGVADFAHFLPLAIVSELVGLDDEGQARMLDWAAGIFNAFGPITSQRTLDGLAIAQEVIAYVLERVDRNTMVSGGWGEALFLAAAAGLISEQTARMMLIDYLTPALDTTINALSSALELFAAHPDQWDRLRADPALMPHAINEIIRIESPIRAFSRYVTADVDIGGMTIPAGSRALMLYACANRDPQKFPDPAHFDIGRKAGDHLGFGMGTHVCAGMHLAKLEITIILEAMVRNVSKINAAAPFRQPHNTLRGLASLRCSFNR